MNRKSNRTLRFTLVGMLVLCCLYAHGQYRTYRVEDNGIETVGYCMLEKGKVTHKFMSSPADGVYVSAGDHGDFTVDVPLNTTTVETFEVGKGITFDMVFNAIQARHCLRQGYLNFQVALTERDRMAFSRQIKAIVGFIDNAELALRENDRIQAAETVRRLSHFVSETPFGKGRPAKGIVPEFTRLLENAMKATLVFEKDVTPNYTVVHHRQKLEEVKTKKKRRR